MKTLIVNADDFGASPGINRGIVECHEAGIVTSASLMVDMPGAKEAIRLARAHSGLGVGLHVVLTSEDGAFVVDPDRREQSRAAIEAQILTFENLMGTLPSHLDAHHNVYRDSRLMPLFLEAASSHSVPLREHSAATYFPDFYGQWDGETHLEQIGVESLCAMLSTRIGAGVTELGCHPGYADGDFESTYLIEREFEVRTLCDPRVAETIDELGIVLSSFRELGPRAMPGIPA